MRHVWRTRNARKNLLGQTKITDHEEAKGVELAHGAAQRRAFVSRVEKLRGTHGKNNLTVFWELILCFCRLITISNFRTSVPEFVLQPFFAKVYFFVPFVQHFFAKLLYRPLIKMFLEKTARIKY